MTAEDFLVKFQDGREETFPIERFDGRPYLGASDVSLIFGASLYWRPELLKLTLRVGEHRLKVTAQNPNVVVDGEGVHLRSPVLFRGGKMMLPLEFVTEIVAPLAPLPAGWSEKERALRFGSIAHQIQGVDVEERGNGWEVTIRTSGRPSYREGSGEEGSHYLRFRGTHLVTDSLPELLGDSLLSEWAWERGGDTVSLRYVPAGEVRERRVARRLRPEGIILRLSRSPIEEVGEGAAGAVDVLTRPKRGGSGPGVGVVIDPGHGGADAGCPGPGGLAEKEIVLDLALRVRDLLAGKHGVPAALTRKEDADVPLRRRTEIANEAGAAILVSLHVSIFEVSLAPGCEIYILSAGRGPDVRIARALDEATTVYNREPLGGVLGGEIRFVPWDAVQEGHKKASARAARVVGGGLAGSAGVRFLGVREAPVAVLHGADMPAILVEFDVPAGGAEDTFLAGEESRIRVAESLASALAGYLRGRR